MNDFETHPRLRGSGCCTGGNERRGREAAEAAEAARVIFCLFGSNGPAAAATSPELPLRRFLSPPLLAMTMCSWAESCRYLRKHIKRVTRRIIYNGLVSLANAVPTSPVHHGLLVFAQLLVVCVAVVFVASRRAVQQGKGASRGRRRSAVWGHCLDIDHCGRWRSSQM